MSWKAIKDINAKEEPTDAYSLLWKVPAGTTFASVEESVNPAYKKATTEAGKVLYVPSDALQEV